MSSLAKKGVVDSACYRAARHRSRARAVDAENPRSRGPAAHALRWDTGAAPAGGGGFAQGPDREPALLRGLTAVQTAEALGVSVGTVERAWRFIKAWLLEGLDGAR